ncbi:hypothetical protein HWV62_11850 [Athelia sp. TMB]|nr:hypothetical protein HWV62_11850 [Athelia sp. TMB]
MYLNAATEKIVFSTPEGRQLCKSILKARVPYEPHDVRIEGICKMLDGVDLQAILATRSGKTSFLLMFMLVVLTILDKPSLCPSASFPKNPCLLAVCPTKYLEYQMVCCSITAHLTKQTLIFNRPNPRQ